MSEFDVGDVGSSVYINPSEEMWMLGVSMDIRDMELAFETTDIESEVPDVEISERIETTHSWNHCHWVVWWCSLSSSSITVCMVGVDMWERSLTDQ